MIKNGSEIATISVSGSGCLTVTKNLTITSLNFYITNTLTGKNAISVNGMNSLELYSVTIGGESELKDISESLIKVCGGATISFINVNIKNIRFIGNNKYSAVMTNDFSSCAIDSIKGEFNVITGVAMIDLTVTSEGINDHGLHYLLFTDGQIDGNKPSTRKVDIQIKVNFVNNFDEERKVYYNLGDGIIHDLNEEDPPPQPTIVYVNGDSTVDIDYFDELKGCSFHTALNEIDKREELD